MAAEEFNKERYGANYLNEDDFEFAEAYAKHKNEALQKQVEELKAENQEMRNLGLKRGID